MGGQGFILASESPRRLALLAQIGATPLKIIPANIDETPLPGEKPAALALRLAVAKARAISCETAPILGADTVVSVGRRILPKAETPTDAMACLALLSGRTHQVTTAIALAHGNRLAVRTAGARVRMKRLSHEEVNAYLRSEEWRGKAGGYAIQGRAGRFVSEISGSYTAIVGLPLYETANLLAGFGILCA